MYLLSGLGGDLWNKKWGYGCLVVYLGIRYIHIHTWGQPSTRTRIHSFKGDVLWGRRLAYELPCGAMADGMPHV